VFGHESYHPNALGQYLIEQSILRQADFKSDIPPLFPPTIAKQSLAILAVPKSGRPIYSLTPNATLTAPGAKPGSKLTIAVNGVRDGLMPNTAYDIHWDGPSRLMLGSVTSDGQADLDAAVSIPADADGEHRIDVVGPNQAGETADITQQIYISTEPNIPQAGELPARIMPDQNTNIRNGVGERAIRHRQAARPPLNTNINLAGKTIRKSEPKPYIFNWLWLLAALIGLWLGLVLATLIKRLLQ